MTKQELLDLRQEIDDEKENLSKLEGRKETLMEQLLEKYDVKTVAAAKKKVKDLEKEITELGEQIEIATVELEDQLDEQGTAAQE